MSSGIVQLNEKCKFIINKGKTMKKLLLLSALISSNVLAANDVILNKVTLFLKGAELQGQSIVSLKKGENAIVLTGIANGAKANSISIGFNNNNVKVLSTSLNKNYIDSDEQNNDTKPLLEKLQQLQEKYDITAIQLKAVSEQINLLQGNHLDQLTKVTNDNVSGMKNILDFIKANLVAALSEQYTLEKEVQQLEQQIEQCQEEFEKLARTTKNLTNAIDVKVYSDQDITLPITISYVTNEASWNPTYDVRVDDINSPVQLTYKAEIHQNSGLDWKNIDFKLSTSNPSEGITAPNLSPWYIKTSNPDMGDYRLGIGYPLLEDRDDMMSLSHTNTVNNATINTLGISTIFEVILPYTIKSNTNDNILILQNREVVANYHYVATPKINNYVFLQAQIADWDRLNLLPGKLTVFFNGSYIGESFIDTKYIKDTLDIALGRDKNILINRNRNVNETSKPSFFGNNISQKYAYTIDVKNSKSLPIDIIVYDQLPVILNKAISLDDVKYGNADYDKDTGKLTWKFKLNPNESKNLNLSFKLSYSKDDVDDIIGL